MLTNFCPLFVRNSKLDSIKKIILNKGAYYSFYYYSSEENQQSLPEQTQMFILDVKNKKLYALDVNI